jgi:hypothetical protein
MLLGVCIWLALAQRCVTVVKIPTVYVHSGYLKEHQSEEGLAVTDWLPLGCFAVPVSRSVANGSWTVPYL